MCKERSTSTVLFTTLRKTLQQIIGLKKIKRLKKKDIERKVVKTKITSLRKIELSHLIFKVYTSIQMKCKAYFEFNLGYQH